MIVGETFKAVGLYSAQRKGCLKNLEREKTDGK